MTLTEFLLARIAEDEARGRRVHAERCETPAEVAPDSMGRPMEPVCDCDWRIPRVLAECEAKRRLVDLELLHFTGNVPRSGFTTPEVADAIIGRADTMGLRVMASVFADHPDYREEWKP